MEQERVDQGNNDRQKVLHIGSKTVGEGRPVYMIAEMSGNHAGSKERALEIIHAAKESGADCIKIQTYTPDTMTIDCHNPYFEISSGTWEGENLYHLYQRAHTPWEWQADLKAEAEKVGLDFLSTPFDRTSVDFLEDLNVLFYKIASFEIVDIPLLQYVASKGKPMIVSAGMSTTWEIEEMLKAVYDAGNPEIAVLKCSSAYPAHYSGMHLRTIADMKQRFGVPVGLSDHSMDAVSPIIATAMGACIIEKHFCIDRSIDNPDAAFSMEPWEFKEMVASVRKAESAMGEIFYGPSMAEQYNLRFRRSIFVSEDIQVGETFTAKNIRVIRPADGMHPRRYEEVLGKVATQPIKRGTPLADQMVSWETCDRKSASE